jgi:hypothetical protein
MSFLSVGGTNVVFLGIGGTNVDFVEGGTNVVVAVALRSSGAYVGGKKVAASIYLLMSELGLHLDTLLA